MYNAFRAANLPIDIAREIADLIQLPSQIVQNNIDFHVLFLFKEVRSEQVSKIYLVSVFKRFDDLNKLPKFVLHWNHALCNLFEVLFFGYGVFLVVVELLL
jgi:hypothetical protein